MIIVAPNVELWTQQNFFEHVANCATICYGSKGKKVEKDKIYSIINRLEKNQHISPFRHGTVYFKIPKEKYTNNDELYSILLSFEQNVFTKLMFDDDFAYLVLNGQTFLELYNFDKYKLNILKNYQVNEKEFIKDNKELTKYLRFTFFITTQISTSRELNRVSPNNICEESTRFCNYSSNKFNNDVTICQPFWLDMFKSSNDTYIKYDGKTLNSETLENYKLSDFPIENYIMKDINPLYAKTFLGHLYKECTHYLEALKKGLKSENARELLPLCTATHVIYTYTYEEWLNILKLRYYGLTGTPHPNAKLIASKIRKIFIEKGYNIDKDIKN